jgi:hypothetical protein
MQFQTMKQVVQLRIPLIPVVTTRNNVKLILKSTLLQQLRKAAIRWKQTLFVAASEKKVWHLLWVGGASQDKWIVLPSGGASPKARR